MALHAGVGEEDSRDEEGLSDDDETNVGEPAGGGIRLRGELLLVVDAAVVCKPRGEPGVDVPRVRISCVW
jgi:hypothetical protein